MVRPHSQPDVFKAISDPTRRRLLAMLRSSNRTLGELAPYFPMTKSGLSQHLTLLRSVGLARSQTIGTDRVWSLCAQSLIDVAAWIKPFEKLIESNTPSGPAPTIRPIDPPHPRPRSPLNQYESRTTSTQ